MSILNNKLYVGNLSWGVTDYDLGKLFSDVGEVTSASVIMDRETGRSRGFGFVEMSTEEEANEAFNTLNNTSFEGRELTVKIADSERREKRSKLMDSLDRFAVGAEIGESVKIETYDNKQFTISRDK